MILWEGEEKDSEGLMEKKKRVEKEYKEILGGY